jgi:hypothetical protein
MRSSSRSRRRSVQPSLSSRDTSRPGVGRVGGSFWAGAPLSRSDRWLLLPWRVPGRGVCWSRGPASLSSPAAASTQTVALPGGATLSINPPSRAGALPDAIDCCSAARMRQSRARDVSGGSRPKQRSCPRRAHPRAKEKSRAPSATSRQLLLPTVATATPPDVVSPMLVAEAVSQTIAVVAGAQRFSLVPDAHARNMALDVEIATLRAIFQPDAVDQQKHHCDHPTNTFRCVTFVKQTQPGAAGRASLRPSVDRSKRR